MKLLVDALAWIGVIVAIGVTIFVTIMTFYLIKQARWETNLKHYTIKNDKVYDPQGFEVNAVELLKELKSIEESIAK